MGGAQAVLQVFDRVSRRFENIFEDLSWHSLPLLEAAILLSVNLSASGPAGHQHLVPLVKPVCLQILKKTEVSDRLRGNTILLLANLSMTMSTELRALGVGDTLLDLLQEKRISEEGKSVAESVIIYLHGHEKCGQIDALMETKVISRYCVPILRHALAGTQFRTVYPYLLYSARLFKVLSTTREYAEALAAEDVAITLLLRANHRVKGPRRVTSDVEGRVLALEVLRSFARLGLWPRTADLGVGKEVVVGESAEPPIAMESRCNSESEDDTAVPVGQVSKAFLEEDLPLLLADEHAGIRSAAIGLWATLHWDAVVRRIIIGHRLHESKRIRADVWRDNVLVFIFPFLAAGH